MTPGTRRPHHRHSQQITLLAQLAPSDRARLASVCELKERVLRDFLRETGWPVGADDCLSLATLALLLDVKKKTVSNQLSEGRMPASHRWHGERRFPVRTVAEWIVLTDFPLGAAILSWRSNIPESSR